MLIKVNPKRGNCMTNKISLWKKLFTGLLAVTVLLWGTILFISCGEKNSPPLNSGGSFDTESNTEQEIETGGITVTKKSSHDILRTVHPGETITYSYVLTNSSAKTKTVDIVETLPTNTTYVSGDLQLDGETLTMNVSVPTGDTVNVSYEVTVRADKSLLGKYVSDSAKVNEETLSCNDILIGYTLNETDQEKFTKAITALQRSTFQGIDLIKYLYRIAFTETPVVKDAPSVVLNYIFNPTDTEKFETYTSLVVPSLWGGVKTDETEPSLPGSKTEVSFSDISIGDILCVLSNAEEENSGYFYVTDGIRLYDITKKFKTVDVATISQLETADYYAVLRPSLALVSDSGIRSKPLLKGETEVEKAIIATAEAFLLRGDRVQYADMHLFNSTNDTDDEYRWERGKAPEDYTLGELGYNNCAGFAHDVILNALGFDYPFRLLESFSDETKAFVYKITGNETEQEKATVAEQFKSKLQIGDIIYYPYASSNSSHVLVYIGNGNIAHCTGNYYSATSYKEYYEPAIRYLNVDNLFDPTSARYVFQTATKREALYIIRMMNIWDGTDVPFVAKQRFGDMNGIVAEKLCSSTLGQTINPGDTITYTFNIFNTTAKTVSLNVTDSVPDGCTLLVNGKPDWNKILAWTVELKPYEEKQLSYTVKVSEDFPIGEAVICSDASMVEGIPVKATPVFVGRTLTTEEQARLCEIVNKYVGSSLSAVALANAIYQELLDVENLLGADLATLSAELFLTDGDYKKIATEGKYAKMIAPSLYGGKKVMNSDRFLGERTRMPFENNLIVGDILFLQGRTSSTYSFCIYMGDGVMLNLGSGLSTIGLSNRLEATIGWQHFCVLRPSLGVE